MTNAAGRKPVIGMFPKPLAPAALDKAGQAARFVTVADPRQAKGLDALVISRRSFRPLQLVEAAVEAGARAILCQSPLASTLNDAQAIVNGCAKQGVTLAMAFSCRYSPALQRLREQVRGGALGDLLALGMTSYGAMPEGWSVDKTVPDGGLTIDRGVQAADLASWLLGREPTEVYAEMSNGRSGANRASWALLSVRYGSIFSTLDVRWSAETTRSGMGEAAMQVVGTGGVLDLDMFSQSLTLTSATDGRVSWPHWGSDIQAGMIADFARLVAGEPAPNLATGIDALRALEVALAAYRSAELGEPVAVNRA